jgi:Tfp pilus assembly protein PilF
VPLRLDLPPASTSASAGLTRALEIYRELGDTIRQAETLNAIGGLLLASGQPVQARTCHEQAIALIRDRTAPVEQARALQGIGRCHLAEGRAADADAPLHEALAICRQLGTAV